MELKQRTVAALLTWRRTRPSGKGMKIERSRSRVQRSKRLWKVLAFELFPQEAVPLKRICWTVPAIASSIIVILGKQSNLIVAQFWRDTTLFSGSPSRTVRRNIHIEFEPGMVEEKCSDMLHDIIVKIA